MPRWIRDCACAKVYTQLEDNLHFARWMAEKKRSHRKTRVSVMDRQEVFGWASWILKDRMQCGETRKRNPAPRTSLERSRRPSRRLSTAWEILNQRETAWKRHPGAPRVRYVTSQRDMKRTSKVYNLQARRFRQIRSSMRVWFWAWLKPHLKKKEKL